LSADEDIEIFGWAALMEEETALGYVARLSRINDRLTLVGGEILQKSAAGYGFVNRFFPYHEAEIVP
jgi:hypothetical protein